MLEDDGPYSPEDALYIEERRNTAKTKLDVCQKSLTDYTAVATALVKFNEQPRRHVMASVCNGLAYFDAVVEDTNTFTVLLGDGWFVERSAQQATAIAQRRINLLKDEEKVLNAQLEQLNETLKFAHDEIARGASRENGDDGDDGDASSDTDSFDSCDQPNLRELEQLEEVMLRETGGGEWSDEELEKRVRDLKVAKRERRLAEEAKAQSVATVKGGEENTAPAAPSSSARSAAPRHPGEIGRLTVAEAKQELEAAFGPRRPSSGVVVAAASPAAAAVAAPPAVASTTTAARLSVSDAPVVEREVAKSGLASMGNNAATNNNDNSSSEATAPKKQSLFKQRRAGGNE